VSGDCFATGGGGNSGGVSEEAAEVFGVGEAAAMGDVVDVEAGFGEQRAGEVEAEAMDFGGGGSAEGCLEAAVEPLAGGADVGE